MCAVMANHRVPAPAPAPGSALAPARAGTSVCRDVTVRTHNVGRLVGVLMVLLLIDAGWLAATQGGSGAVAVGAPPWWFWPLILFAMTFVMGILAAVGGVGGGVLFVPIVSGFCPFHLDFVRCTGLLVALCGALAAGPGFLRMNLANLRLAMPVALIASTCAIAGAMVGLALPTDVVQTALGATILGIVLIMIAARKSTFPAVPRADRLSQVLRIHGVYMEASLGQTVDWKIHRTVPGLLLFTVIGFMAGMFGLGAGWANVPVLNLVLGAPLKVSVATSKFLLSITDTSAAWVYVNQGCVIPMMVVPSLIGIMLGSFIGVRILRVAKPGFVRWMVIGLLLFAGGKAITKGLGLPFII